MKSILKRILSVILTLAMLLSLVSVPAYAEDSFNGEVELVGKFTSDIDGQNTIYRVAEGENFRMWLYFSSHSNDEESIHAYDLLIEYDPDKISFPEGADSVEECLTSPTFNHEFTSGVAYAGWASTDGIVENGEIKSSGKLFAIDMKAETELTSSDLGNIEIIDEATNGVLTQYTQIKDANGKKFEYEYKYNAVGGSGGPEETEKTEINESDFTFDLRDKEYTGREIKPEVESDLREGTDYEVTYSDNIEAGTATITVTGIGDYTGTITKTFEIIEEVVPAKSLKFASTKLTIYENNEYDLAEKLTVKPVNSNDTIEWTSSKEEVVTVDENGVLTAVSMGTAKITAKAVNGKKSATCTVTVARLPEWIELTGDNAVAKGKTIKLNAAAYYFDEVKEKDVKTKDTISWRSEDETIATVSGGKVKGISAGTTTIVAYIEGTDLEETIEVSVVVPVKSLKLATTKLTIYENNDYDLSEKLTISPDDHNDIIEWTSSKEEVVTVDENGVLTAVSMGTAKITVEAVAGGKSATCTVTVAREPEGIILEGDNAVAQGKTVTLKAYAYYLDDDGDIVKTKDTISWRSDDEDIATVSGGKVKGISAGTTTIVAYIEGTDLEETIEVSVVVPVKSLKLATTELTIYENNDYDLGEKLTISPDDHNDIIEWTSSKEEVVTVDENGVLTAVSMGTAKITVEAVAGGKSATCTVTVAREPEGIILEGDNAVAQGKTVTLKAYAYYLDDDGDIVKTKDTISWRVEDEDIATVSGGKVKGISAGTTTVYAYVDGTDLEEAIEVSVVVPVKSLKLATTKLTIYENNDYDLSEKLTISPDGHNDIIEWTSSNEDVVEVDENGVLTAVSMGTAKITVEAVAGGKSATCSVTVARLPEGIFLTDDGIVAQGKTITLEAYAFYFDETKNDIVKTKDVISWRSADEDIATVSGGKVKGISAGRTRIYAYIDGTDLEEWVPVEVIVPAKSVEFEMSKLDALVGDEIDLSDYLIISPEDSNDDIEWVSSNEDVAIVNRRGVVYIEGEGTAKITAKAVMGGKSDYITISAEKRDITNEELRFHISSSFGEVAVEGENLEIVQNGDNIEVTISGIDVEDSYITNHSSSDIDVAEYNWEVVMYDSTGAAYSVSTSWFAFEPGLNEEMSMGDMQHSLWSVYDDGGYWLADVSNRRRDDSITWKFSFPAGYSFDFENAERFEVRVNGTLNDEYIERIYTRDGSSSGGGGGGSTPGGSDNPDDDEPTDEPKEYSEYRMDVGGNCIYMDDEVIEGEYPIVLHKDDVFAPVRLLADAFGCDVSYDGETRTITFEKGEKIISYEQDDELYAVIDDVSYINVVAFLIDMFGDEFTIIADEDGISATRNETESNYTFLENHEGNPLRISWEDAGIAAADSYRIKFDGYGLTIGTGRTVTGLAPILASTDLVNGKLAIEMYTGPNWTDLTPLYEKTEIANITLNNTTPTFTIEKDELGKYNFVSAMTGGMWVYELCNNDGVYYYVNNDINGAIDPYANFADGYTVKARYVTWTLNEDKTYAELSVSDFATYTYNEDASDDEVTGTITLVQHGEYIEAEWAGYDSPNGYTWALVDRDTGKIQQLDFLPSHITATTDFKPCLTRIESGVHYFDFVLYEYDESQEDCIGKELGRLENAAVVTIDGAAVDYELEVTNAAGGQYKVTFADTPASGDTYLTRWNRGTRNYSSTYISDGSDHYTEATFMGAIQSGDIFDLRKLTNYTLEGQTMKATITLPSYHTYEVEGLSFRKWNTDVMFDGYDGAVYSLEFEGEKIVSTQNRNMSTLLFGYDQSKGPMWDMDFVVEVGGAEVERFTENVDVELTGEDVSFVINQDGTLSFDDTTHGAFVYEITKDDVVTQMGRIAFNEGALVAGWTLPTLSEGETIDIIHVNCIYESNSNTIAAYVSNHTKKKYVSTFVESNDIWFSDDNESGRLQVEWTPVELGDDLYWFDGWGIKVPYYNVLSILGSVETNEIMSIDVYKGDGDPELLYSAENILTVSIEGTAKYYTVTGQADGTYKISAPSGSSGNNGYIYEICTADGTEITSGFSKSGNMSVSLYEGCQIKVREVKWTIAENGRSANVVLTPYTTLTSYTECPVSDEIVDVTTYEELEAILKVGGRARLVNDIASENELRLYKGAPAELILNGYTLDVPLLQLDFGKTLVIDGTVAGSKILYSNGTNKIGSYFYSSLTINGGTYQKLYSHHIRETVINSGTFDIDPTEFVNTDTHNVIANDDGTYTVEEKAVSDSGITLVQEGNAIYATWDDAGEYSYYFEFVDGEGNRITSGWTNGDECVTSDLAHYIPRASENTTYSLVVYGADEAYNLTDEIVRADNCIDVTVSGDAIEYDMEFNSVSEGVHSITIGTIPEGIWYLDGWYNAEGKSTGSLGSGSVSGTKTKHQAIQNGYSYDLRVLTSFALDGQVIKATITPESKKTYINEDEPKIKWNANGVITWQESENVDHYRLNVYLGESVDADNFITYKYVGNYGTIFYFDSNFNVADLAGHTDSVMTVELVAYDANYQLIEVVGTLTLDVSFTEEAPVFDIDITDEKTYTITFEEGTPDGMRYLEWFDADGNSIGGRNGFGYTSLTQTYTRPYAFADGDWIEVYITTHDSVTDTVWSLTRTPVATYTYTAE